MNIDYKKGIKRLVEEYKDIIEEIVKEKNNWRRKIEKNDLPDEDCKYLLKRIAIQILIQGRSAKSVETQINKFEKEISGEWSIENIENNMNKLKMANWKKDKLKKILEYIKSNSIGDWIIKLHNGDASIPRIGLKSDDDFLKELGFYEHVPIDRHIKRFLFRTGIIHWYFKEKSEKGEDILKLFDNNRESKYKLFQKIMKTFCKEFCDDIEICGLKLSENPGILDNDNLETLWRERKERM